MAILKWDAFEWGHSGSQVREGLVDSGSSKPEIGHVRETHVRVELVDHGRGRGRSCLNDSQGQSFKDDWVMHLSRKQARKEAGLCRQ